VVAVATGVVLAVATGVGAAVGVTVDVTPPDAHPTSKLAAARAAIHRPAQ
jgi:hypothetical protein